MCAPDGPDTTKQDAIAARVQDLNETQFAWVKQQWEADAPNRQRATDIAQQVSQEQLDTMREQRGLAQESASDYRRIYRPLEEQAAREAATFDSEDRQHEAAGKAIADVQQRSDIMRGATERNLASMGVNASDGNFAATFGELDNQAVLQGAMAANSARDRVQTVGRALRADAIGVGRGVVGSQGTQAGLTLTAGSQALGTATVPSQMNQSGVGMVQQAAGQASNGLMGAANIYQNSSNARYQAGQDSASGTGALAGAAMSAAAIF